MQVGVLTSYSIGRRGGEHVGLGYVKKRVISAEQVLVGDVSGTLVDAPFLSFTKL